jgi:hypothetical protein
MLAFATSKMPVRTGEAKSSPPYFWENVFNPEMQPPNVSLNGKATSLKNILDFGVFTIYTRFILRW